MIIASFSNGLSPFRLFREISSQAWLVKSTFARLLLFLQLLVRHILSFPQLIDVRPNLA